MTQSELYVLSREHMLNTIPSSMRIDSVEMYEKFKIWARLFEPNITSITFSIPIPEKRVNSLSYVIDYVPKSVKEVNIEKFEYICPFTRVNLPDTVEVLKINESMASIERLPANIRRLTLGYKFLGLVKSFRSNLEVIDLFGYDHGGLMSCEINDLPDTIHTLHMYAWFPGYITHWPKNSRIYPEDPYSDEENEELFDD